ncbi:MAG: hypothetical protein WBB91_08855, partial [Nostocoides sp.]|uniref:hypothetical protein n=1 Tax=Nostocoides sp. TaxID=1917966 RepID=UPI003C76D396
MTKESESYRRRMLLGGVPQGADALRRIVIALAGLVGVTAIGTFGYMLIADLTFRDRPAGLPGVRRPAAGRRSRAARVPPVPQRAQTVRAAPPQDP